VLRNSTGLITRNRLQLNTNHLPLSVVHGVLNTGSPQLRAPETRPRALNREAMPCCCCAWKKKLDIAGGCLFSLFFFFSPIPFWLLAFYTVDFYVGSSPGPGWYMRASLLRQLRNDRASQNWVWPQVCSAVSHPFIIHCSREPRCERRTDCSVVPERFA